MAGATLFTLLAKLGIDAADYTKGLDQATKHADRSSASILGSFAKISTGVAVGFTAVTAVATAAAGVATYLMVKAIGPASDLAETVSKVGVVFGNESDAMMAWASDSATAMGMTRNEALSAAGTYGNLFRSMGITTTSSSKMSKGLVELASDLASFNNMDPSLVLDKLRAGLSGETEPLKTLGVNINQVLLEQKALNMGLWNGIGPLNAAAKAQASYALILEQTTLAQGDFARTSTGLANQQRILKASWGDLTANIGSAFLPAAQEVMRFLTMLVPLISGSVLPALQSLGGAITDVAREWTRGIANLIVDAANWGANIVQSLANGIQGSSAVVNALQNVASQITMWLQPGSPPKLLPDLPEWGAGAIQSWLDGWSINSQMTSGLLKDLRSSLRPFLEQIDLGKELDLGQVEAKFGANAPDVKAYLGAYKKVSSAVGDVQDAREALKKAEAGGDLDAIAAAQKKLKAAEANENLSRRTFYEHEARLAARISAETKITKAIEQQGAVAAKVAGEASNLAEEAKQRAIDQAFLQYRLAVAGTAGGQIPIWEEELAKVAEGSAEYWQIQTRLVELRRAVEKEAAGVGKALGGSLVGGLEDGVAAEAEQGFNDSGAAVSKGMGKIDWGGIGKAIGGSIITGLIDRIKSLPADLVALSNKALEWSKLASTEEKFKTAGYDAAKFLIDGMIDLIESVIGAQMAGDALSSQMATVIGNLQGAFGNIGKAIGTGVLGGILSYFFSEEAAMAIATAVMSALVKALPYITPAGQAKLVWGFLTKGAEDIGTSIGGWAGDKMPGVQDWLQQPAPDWIEGILGGGGNVGGNDVGANSQSSVVLQPGAVVINVNGSNAATVREDARAGANIGVMQGLRAAGVFG